MFTALSVFVVVIVARFVIIYHITERLPSSVIPIEPEKKKT